MNWSDYSQEFLNIMLGRLQFDCKAFVDGCRKGQENRIWALSVKEHIKAMREIYNQLNEKPNWLSKKQIIEYETAMLALL